MKTNEMMMDRKYYLLKGLIGVGVVLVLVLMFKSFTRSEYVIELKETDFSSRSQNKVPIDINKSITQLHDSESNENSLSESNDILADTITEFIKDVNTQTTVPSIPTTTTNPTTTVKSTTAPQITIAERVRQVTNCSDRKRTSHFELRGEFWVLYNYIPAEREYKCHESVTFTTHADYSFLDNLPNVVDRWRGPISIALHAPGYDFQDTLASIAHLRECSEQAELIREFVTFHIYFNLNHLPEVVPRPDQLFKEPYNCSIDAPYQNVSTGFMYKSQKNLLYPVNVGRNVARQSALTHFVLPCDIELYPIRNLPEMFLEMIAANEEPINKPGPKVFTLPLFEVDIASQVPDNKVQLQAMLANKTAVPFHQYVCPQCHKVPKSKEWVDANITEGLHVFTVGKRMGSFVSWEPIFIGTHSDPLYDERLSWEGKRDKMTQGYAFCVLDYDFLILDNAFLVHRPGIKIYKPDPERDKIVVQTNQLISRVIYPELKLFYGTKEGCRV